MTSKTITENSEKKTPSTSKTIAPQNTPEMIFLNITYHYCPITYGRNIFSTNHTQEKEIPPNSKSTATP